MSVENWAEIRRLHRAEGVPIKAIAQRLGISRNAVRRALASQGPPRYRRPVVPVAFDAVESQVRALLREFPDMPATVLAERVGGKFPEELKRLGRIPLLVIDEIGYLPFEPEAANLFFQLISARYERVSVIVTSNKPFSRWGEVFGDDTVAAAMIDRLVHHADIVAIKGDSYRLKDRDLGRTPPTKTD